MGQDAAVDLTLRVAERLLHPPVEFRLRLLHGGQVGGGQHVPGAGSLAGVVVQHLAQQGRLALQVAVLVKVSGENDVGFSEVGQHVDPLHQRGQPLVDHLKEDDTQAVYVHFLERLRKNT